MLGLGGATEFRVSNSKNAVAAAQPPGYLSIILGRSLYSKGTGNCPNATTPTGMMTIDQYVPDMYAMGVNPTAAVIPDRMGSSGTNCASGDLYPSWSDLQSLSQSDGLSVVSATTDYNDLPDLAESAQVQDSCGSLQPLISEGFHNAWGMLAYPDNELSTQVQTQVVQNCFAFGRDYETVNGAQTNTESGTAANSWFQNTVNVGGGNCTASSCSGGPFSGTGNYASPTAIAALTDVPSGDWTAIQFYSFVTGSNLSGSIQWDCTGSTWQQHWTNKFEVYCWNDFVSAMAAVASDEANGSLVVTDPATVANAWGRVPTPVVSIDSVSPPSLSGSSPSTTVAWQSWEEGTYSVLINATGCNSGTPVATGTYTTPQTDTNVTLPASDFPSGQDTILVCLTNDAGHTGSASQGISVTGAAPPTVSGVSPAQGPLAGGTAIVINGTNFASGATVSVDGQPATDVSVTSATSITAVVPAVTSAGSVDVQVSEGAGTSATSPSDQFLYEAAPTVTGVSPSMGPVTGGTPIAISGDNFYPDATVAVDGQAATDVSVASPMSITAEVPAAPSGNPVTADVLVAEAGGTSPPVAADQFTWMAVVPGAPTGVSASAGASAATVAFTPPASNGGSPITSYQVTATDVSNSANGGQTATGSGSPITVSGLTDGDSYTFTVSAVNGVGTGQTSSPSNAVTPTAALPGAPTGVSAAAGAGAATVSFTPPANNGGSPITGYTDSATDLSNSANGGQTATGSGSPITVTGLTNGDSYTFSVTAGNAAGSGPSSSPSNAVTPATLPGAPSGASATAGPSAATVVFTPPASNGGSPVIAYQVTATDVTNSANGGQTATGSGSPITVTGLTNGDSYTFTVTAGNGVGSGPPSSSSNAVTPATLPGAPSGVSATAGADAASIAFTPPASNGGSPITAYQVTATDLSNSANGGQIASGSASPITVTGLTAGDSYTFAVSALNGVGTGPASSPSNAVTPTSGLSVTSVPPWAAVGVHYSTTLEATGGTAPYKWSLPAGSSPPAGLKLSTTGILSGTPSASGTGGFTVQVKDSANPAHTTTASLSLTVYATAANGSGTATFTPARIVEGSSGNVLVFHYTAPSSGALDGGTVQITIPSGWTAPSLSSASPGFVLSSTGTVAVSGQTITVSLLRLAPGQSVKITYGSIANGGVTAPAKTGGYTFGVKQASTTTGTLTALSTSPVVTVAK